MEKKVNRIQGYPINIYFLLIAFQCFEKSREKELEFQLGYRELCVTLGASMRLGFANELI